MRASGGKGDLTAGKAAIGTTRRQEWKVPEDRKEMRAGTAGGKRAPGRARREERAENGDLMRKRARNARPISLFPDNYGLIAMDCFQRLGTSSSDHRLGP